MKGLAAVKQFVEDLGFANVTSGLVASIFGCTGPVIILINIGADGGLSQGELISWIFSVYIIGGLLGIYLSMKFRIPISGAWSIPAAIFVGTMLREYSFSSIVGAYLVSSLIILLLGYARLTSKILSWIPVPVIMAMVAGSMLGFGMNVITSFENTPLISTLAVTGYLLSLRWSSKIPPILGAILLSVIGLLITGQLQSVDHSLVFMGPRPVIPEFHLTPILSISIPVALLALGVNNAQAVGVLISQGYSVPVDHMTKATGFASLFASFFGGHGATIAGPKTAICASSTSGKDLSKRYVATVIDGLLFIVFGLFSSYAISLLTVFPVDMIQLIAGLAMLPVLMAFFRSAFSTGEYQTGAFIAFLLALSDFTLFNISAPFWALVFGSLIRVNVKKLERT